MACRDSGSCGAESIWALCSWFHHTWCLCRPPLQKVVLSVFTLMKIQACCCSETLLVTGIAILFCAAPAGESLCKIWLMTAV